MSLTLLQCFPYCELGAYLYHLTQPKHTKEGTNRQTHSLTRFIPCLHKQLVIHRSSSCFISCFALISQLHLLLSLLLPFPSLLSFSYLSFSFSFNLLTFSFLNCCYFLIPLINLTFPCFPLPFYPFYASSFQIWKIFDLFNFKYHRYLSPHQCFITDSLQTSKFQQTLINSIP